MSDANGRARWSWVAGTLGAAGLALPAPTSARTVEPLAFGDPGTMVARAASVAAPDRIELVEARHHVRSEDVFASPGLLDLGVEGAGRVAAPFDPEDDSFLGEEPVWALDEEEGGDVAVLVRASLCDAPGRCVGGHGNLRLPIPTDLVGIRPFDYLIFDAEADRISKPDGGLGAWWTRSTGVAPQPSAAVVFSMGLVVTGARMRRRR